MNHSINPKDILITGGGGMVGSYIDFGTKTDRLALDVTNFQDVMKYVASTRPKAIIHLAAETDLEVCERDPDRAYLVNGVSAYYMASAALAVGAKLVYVSTAGIFDGEKNGPYTEDDKPNPQNVYGRSKHMGELIVRGMTDNHIIARACWMFGGGPKKDVKFVAKIIAQLGKGEIKAVDDAYGSPTFGKDLVAGLKQLIMENATGTYNLSNAGACSRYDVAKLTVDIMNPSVKVTPVPLEYFPGVLRVKNETMISRVKIMRPWQEALRDYLDTEWKDFKVKENQ